MDISEFDPMNEPWDGTALYSTTETDGDGNPTAQPEWVSQITYSLPTAAQVIRESVCSPEVMPPSPRMAIISEALALAVLSTWMPGAETCTLVAKPTDFAAVVMTATACMMAQWPMVGEAEDGVEVSTGYKPAYTLPESIFCRPMLQEAAEALPVGTTLNDVAAMLDSRAPGVGQWRRALAVITPQAKAA